MTTPTTQALEPVLPNAAAWRWKFGVNEDVIDRDWRFSTVPLMPYGDRPIEPLYTKEQVLSAIAADRNKREGEPTAANAVVQAIKGEIPLVEPVHICKALRAGREARAVLSGGTGPVAAVHLVNIGLTGWIYTKDTAEAYAKGYNDGVKHLRAAVLEVAENHMPSGYSAGEVSPTPVFAGLSDEEILNLFYREIGGEGFALYEVTPGNMIAFARVLEARMQRVPEGFKAVSTTTATDEMFRAFEVEYAKDKSWHAAFLAAIAAAPMPGQGDV